MKAVGLTIAGLDPSMRAGGKISLFKEQPHFLICQPGNKASTCIVQLHSAQASAVAGGSRRDKYSLSKFILELACWCSLRGNSRFLPPICLDWRRLRLIPRKNAMRSCPLAEAHGLRTC